MTLSDLLAQQIAKNIGANSVSIGKIGLAVPEFLTDSQLKLSDEDGVVKYAPMWYSEAKGCDNIVCCLLALLDPDFEICAVFMFKDFSGDIEDCAIGLKLDEDGMFLSKSSDRWLPMTMAQKLQFALAIEVMVQDGIVWEPADIPEEIRKNLVGMISVDNAE
jgi:hypothetical protein